MKRNAILVLLLSLLLPLNAAAERLVREFSGSRTTQTAEFEVEAPWLIDWRVNSDYEESMGLAIVLPWIGHATWHAYKDTIEAA